MWWRELPKLVGNNRVGVFESAANGRPKCGVPLLRGQQTHTLKADLLAIESRAVAGSRFMPASQALVHPSDPHVHIHSFLAVYVDWLGQQS